VLEVDFAFNFPDWHRDALCQEYADRGDWWFPAKGQTCSNAKAVCEKCLVQAECLGWALDEGPQLPGVWGGATEVERKQLLRDGRLTGDLVREWGHYAVQGRIIERDREDEANRWAPSRAVFGMSAHTV